MIFQGRCKNSQGRYKTISGEVRTSAHLLSKSGHAYRVNIQLSTFKTRHIKAVTLSSLRESQTLGYL
jgi:hypothetical protein